MLLVYCSKVSINFLDDISLLWQNGNLSVFTTLSSKSQLGIRGSSSGFLVKSSITELIKRIGKPADRNFFLILKTSSSNEEAILLALWSSPVIAFLLYLLGVLDDHGVGNLFFLVKTLGEIIPSVDIMEVSKNSLGLATAVSFMLGCSYLGYCKDNLPHLLIF